MNNFLKFCLFFFPSIIYLYFVYSPVIYLPYAHIDDYYYWVHKITWHNLFARGFAEISGRHLYNFIHYAIAVNLIHDICSLGIVRILGLIFISISVTIFAIWLCHLVRDKKVVFFLSLSIFMLPGMNFFIFMGVCVPYIVGIIFSLISALLIDKVDPKMLSPLRPSWTKNIKHLILVVLSLILFISSLYTYQIFAMFYLVPGVCVMVFKKIEDWPTTRLKLILNLIVFGIGCTIYYVVQKFILLPIALLNNPGIAKSFASEISHRFDLVPDLTTLLTRKMNLFSIVAIRTFNLWKTTPGEIVMFFLIGIIIIGILIAITRTYFGISDSKKRFLRIRHNIEIVFLFFIFLIAANAPNILSYGGSSQVRAAFVSAVIIILILIWSLKHIFAFMSTKWKSILSLFILGIILIGSGVITQRNTLQNVTNSNMELNFMRNKILPNVNKLKAIHIIGIAPVGGRFTGDQFNVFTTQNWVGMSPYMIRLILLEYYKYAEKSVRIYPVANSPEGWKNAPKDYIIVAWSHPGEPIYAPPDALIVDMNKMFSKSFCDEC